MKLFHPVLAITAALFLISCGSSEDDNSSHNTQTPEQAQPEQQTPIDQQQPTNPPADQQQPTDPPADQQQPTDPPADQQQPTDPPADQQQPTDPPADQQQPTDPPADQQQPTDPPADQQQPTDPPADSSDPCNDVQCTKGTCSEGVCVTNEMKKIQDDTPCDPETFVEFCDGNRAVYCDRGIVASGTCDEGCAIYEETYFGAVKTQAGCIDGGECSELNELKRSCTMMKEGFGQVMAVACQKTTRNTLRWVSVDGYYCKGLCDGKGEKCALQENECDPYDLSNYSCDHHTLNTCYLDSNLTGNKRTNYCDDKCVTVNKIAMCGYACSNEGEHTHVCMNADSTNIKDSADFYCRKTDSGELYSTWSGTYDLCNSGCNSSTGKCQ